MGFDRSMTDLAIGAGECIASSGGTLHTDDPLKSDVGADFTALNTFPIRPKHTRERDVSRRYEMPWSKASGRLKTTRPSLRSTLPEGPEGG